MIDGCVLVAEIGPARGDVGWAVEAVAAAADSGAQMVKGQIYHRDRLVTRDAPSYGKGITEPATQYEHFGAQLTYAEWESVQQACAEWGVTFFASVFDDDAVTFCEGINVPLYKVASADITHKPLIEAVASTGKPIVLSTGGATMFEYDRARMWIKQISDADVLPLICTLSYPCPPDQAHLDRIRWWTEKVGPCGYSDHTVGAGAMIVARSAGAVMIEKHFTVTPGVGGDHDFAATPEVFRQYAGEGVVSIDPRLVGSYYIARRTVEEDAVKLARRSVAAATDIVEGQVFDSSMLTFLRPGTGLEPWQVDELIGTVATRAYAAGELI